MRDDMRTHLLFASILFAGCGGQVSGNDNEQPLAEIPTSSQDDGQPGTRRPDWDAESADDETRSTHLWIVNRAVDLLRLQAGDPQADGIIALLSAADCQPSWHQGLVDADFKAAYNGAHWDVPVAASSVELILAGATWESHFYDPDSGRNYKGNTTPTAYDQALLHLANAQAKLAANSRPAGCYELGLSLHYATDITQPMHASNYTAENYPVKLHSDFETYAEAQQTRFVVKSWSGPTLGAPSVQLLAAAHASKALWPPARAAIAASYAAKKCGSFDSYWIDHTNCWNGDAAVDQQLGAQLAGAQTSTANYLYSLALQ
jgi:hypothetical protein